LQNFLVALDDNVIKHSTKNTSNGENGDKTSDYFVNIAAQTTVQNNSLVELVTKNVESTKKNKQLEERIELIQANQKELCAALHRRTSQKKRKHSYGKYNEMASEEIREYDKQIAQIQS
jgi:hypothetical protein